MDRRGVRLFIVAEGFYVVKFSWVVRVRDLEDFRFILKVEGLGRKLYYYGIF